MSKTGTKWNSSYFNKKNWVKFTVLKALGSQKSNATCFFTNKVVDKIECDHSSIKNYYHEKSESETKLSECVVVVCLKRNTNVGVSWALLFSDKIKQLWFHSFINVYNHQFSMFSKTLGFLCLTEVGQNDDCGEINWRIGNKKNWFQNWFLCFQKHKVFYAWQNSDKTMIVAK